MEVISDFFWFDVLLGNFAITALVAQWIGTRKQS